MSTNLRSVLADREYRNWLRAGLSLKYARQGILNLVKNDIDNFHQDLMNGSLAGSQCSNCSTENIVPCRNNNNFCKFRHRACKVHENTDPNKKCKKCPNSVCDQIYTEIVKEHRYTPTWRNTDCRRWCNQAWQLAVCYMPEGYASKVRAADTDFPGILNVIINNRRFDNLVNENMGNKSNIFCQARDVRNTILHNANMRITDTDLADYIQILQTMLSNPKCSTTDLDINNAKARLTEIQNGSLLVTTEDIDEIKAEACRAIEEKKQEALSAVNKSKEEAQADVELKQQNAEIAIKQTADDARYETQKVIECKKRKALSELSSETAISVTAVKKVRLEAEVAIKQTSDDACRDTKEVIEGVKCKVLSDIASQHLAAVEAVNKAKEKAKADVEVKQQHAEIAIKQTADHACCKTQKVLDHKQQDVLSAVTSQEAVSVTAVTSQEAISVAAVTSQEVVSVAAVNKAGEETVKHSEMTIKQTADDVCSVTKKAINDDDNCDESDNDDDDFATASSSCSDNKNGDTDCLRLYPYQLELAEIAVKGLNTIVCAGTGSGKTFVALHIIKQHFEGDRGPRKVAFMAPTSALVKQQSDKCKQYLSDLNVKLVTGEDDNSKMLGLFLHTNDVLCFTPQILVNNLANGSIKSVSDFTLLILDECHHTKGSEPYNILMQEYLEQKTINAIKLPQVLGLTATIGIGKSHTEVEARDYIIRVMACLDVTRLSQVERNKKRYLEKTIEPVEEKIPMSIPGNNPCKEILLKAIYETEDRLQDMALLQPSLIELMVEKCPTKKESQEYQKWTIDVMKKAQQSVDDFNISRNVTAGAKYLNNYNAAIEVNSLLRPADIIYFLAEKHREDSEQVEKLTTVEKELLQKLNQVQKDVLRCKAAENPNVRILSDTLKQMLTDKGDDSRAMVFVKARATCKSLAAFLNTDLGDIDVKTSPLYGKENRGSDDGMTDSVQNDVLEKFRQGLYKVIVATSVGVEGIDVPDCNIVLSYNYSGNEITKIQMKGRSRKSGATTITMGSQKIMEEEEINAYKALMMQAAMKLVRRLPQNEIDKKVKQVQSEEVQKMRFRKQVEESKLQQKTEEDFQIQCRRCNAPVAYLSDIRVIGCHHIVIDKSLENRIMIKPDKSPKCISEGLKKHSMMYCKKCPMDWGIIATIDGLTCRVLKLKSMKFTSVETGVTQFFRKWGDVPGKIEDMKSEDLPRLLGETA